MIKANVVIGAGYGDEGKGLLTDYFSNDQTTVVRFNGGAQAGHTVVTPDGRRHVFGHFGAGTFRGATTFLSRFFVVNPMLFVKELQRLSGLLDHSPKVYIDRNAIITTPYDIMLNQAVENHRGAKRHGSCGVGFGETIERSTWDGASLLASDLEDRDYTRQMVTKIRDKYVVQRMKILKLKADHMSPHLHDDQILDAFMANIDTMLAFARVVDQDLMKGNPNIVFEGAQGLGLDQTRGAFPFVTRSNCGLKNVIELAKDFEIDKLDVAYATRAYTTRHGAGPLKDEVKSLHYANVVDNTNIFNDFQHGLRFAPLNVDELQRRIMDDIIDSFGSGVSVRPRLAVTCIDQLEDGRAELRVTGRLHKNLSHEDFLDILTSNVALKHHFYSTGPTRSDVFGYNKLESVL